MKKTFFLLFILIIGVFNSIKAQDTIFFKNNESKIVKITQIKSNELFCKEFTNLEGPDYIYELKKIGEIHFKNGLVQTYDILDENEVEYINDVAVKKQDLDKYKEPIQNFRLDSYSERNEYYKNVPYHKEYGDPYEPALAGIASYFIPGLGQMICGESGRGLAFLGGTAATYFVTMIGFSGLSYGVTYDYYSGNNNSYNYNNNGSLFTAMAVGGAISTVGLYIWSIVDAVHVAKVNNLYARDLRTQNQVSFQLSPFIDTSKTALSLNNQPALGLSLRMNF